jgi:hypothetical protein
MNSPAVADLTEGNGIGPIRSPRRRACSHPGCGLTAPAGPEAFLPSAVGLAWAAVSHGAGGELLVVAPPHGGELLVPFVKAIVPTVDVAGGRVVLDPPDGLLDP